MSMALECRDLRKRYGAAPLSLGRPEEGINLGIRRGELFAIIGPSGCGKSTLLRLIGGFTEPSTGQILIEGRDVTRLASFERPTNTVFQNYALFPNMTIAGNVAFGLEMDGIGGDERRRRVAQALELVGLAAFADRHVSEISGGQMQRAALARALVKRPAVLLLDEPLGALDLQLRRQMQDEIVRLKEATGATVLHVTHDQEEACAMADRIAVLKDGMVVQVDRPFDLYRAPRTAFVAEFIHAGTVLRGLVAHEGGRVTVAAPAMRVTGLPTGAGDRVAALLPRHGARVRPVAPGDTSGGNRLRATLARLSFTGADFVLRLEAPELSLPVHVPIDAAQGLEPGCEVVAEWPEGLIRLIEDDTAPAARSAAA